MDCGNKIIKDEDTILQIDDTVSNSENLESYEGETLIGWGSTSHGELGIGGIEESHLSLPTKINWKPPDGKVKLVSCGVNHTLVVTYDGKIYSCGNNDFGQLGHSNSRTKLHEITSLESQRIVNAACGLFHSLAVNEWGQVFSWGSNSHGQLGLNIGIGEFQPSPKIIKYLATKNIIQISCGYQHCLALTNDGVLYAWGSNEFGQLGVGSDIREVEVNVVSTVKPLSGMAISFIACGGYHSFCISKSGAVFGWGKNNFGQLGLNHSEVQNVPNQLHTLRSVKVRYIACGEEFSAFLTADGGVFTCGAGMYGQLGHGSLSNEVLPKKIVELMGSTVTQISCGRRHTLTLIPSKGRVYAFGVGGLGQLGIKSLKNHCTPQVVLGPWLPANTLSPNVDSTQEEYVVKCIYSGGDHCFVTVSKKEGNVDPDDFRLIANEMQLWLISEDMLTKCQNFKPCESIDLDIITYFEVVMSSASCINGSFLNKENHYRSNGQIHGIDMEHAAKCFNIISKFQHPSLLETIFSSMENLIKDLPLLPIDLEVLRAYLILPLYHEFMNPKNCENLLVPFGSKFLKIVSMIKEWYKSVEPEYFKLLIFIFKNVFVDKLKSAIPPVVNIKHWGDSMVILLEVLSKLNNINKSNFVSSIREDGYKVPCNTFYVPEINDIVDIKTDYVRWLWTGGDFNFCNYPFLFDAEAKTTLLQTDQVLQMQDAMRDSANAFFFFNPTVMFDRFLEIHISRDRIVEDAIRELSMHDARELKKPLRVNFLGEEAEDFGGVRKEFFMLVFKDILDPKYGMFDLYEETRTIWFKEDSFEDGIMFFLIGLLCGLAIYNFTILNLSFPLVLYKKILDEPVKLQDIKGLSPTLYKSLDDLLNYTDADLEEVFLLNFSITKEVFGEIKTIPLKPDGQNIPVTQENKYEFVDLYVDMLLNKSVEKQFKPFKDGFLKVCGGRVLQLFHSQELMAAVIGNEDYDWNELEKNAEYKKGYRHDDPTIQMFWEVFHELSVDEKRKFLLFLTGSDRIPIQGMKAIKIYIQPTADEDYLPVAHTCFNLLDLPRYQTKKRLKTKLLQSIQQNQGFSLV